MKWAHSLEQKTGSVPSPEAASLRKKAPLHSAECERTPKKNTEPRMLTHKTQEPRKNTWTAWGTRQTRLQTTTDMPKRKLASLILENSSQHLSSPLQFAEGMPSPSRHLREAMPLRERLLLWAAEEIRKEERLSPHSGKDTGFPCRMSFKSGEKKPRKHRFRLAGQPTACAASNPCRLSASSASHLAHTRTVTRYQ